MNRMPGGTHSRFVAWAKILLPLAALALMATLFMIARQIDPDAAIPFAQVDVERFAREARIGGPEISGVTADGTVVSISAAAARPDPSAAGRMTTDNLAARFELPRSGWIEVRAASGVVDNAERRMTLGDGVEIGTSTGYRIRAGALTAGLGETVLVSDGPVTAEGPPGSIEAGSMVVSRRSDAADAPYLLVFNGGVKLVYQPPD